MHLVNLKTLSVQVVLSRPLSLDNSEKFIALEAHIFMR